jgi:hypothetical protein
MGPKEWSPRFNSKKSLFDFPVMTALIDNMKAVSYAIKFVKETNLNQFTELKPGHHKEICVLDHDYRCKASDALMVVRPWIRVGRNVSKQSFDILRTSQYILRYDGVAVIKGSVERILIGEDDQWIWKHPYEVPSRDKSVYDAAPMDEENRAWGEKRFANFIPNETFVSMKVNIDWNLESPLFLYAGLVAALYTTGFRELD